MIISPCVTRDVQELKKHQAFIEKLINLDEKKKYYIITCGEEVHFAYNRVGYVHSALCSSLDLIPSLKINGILRSSKCTFRLL